MAAPQRARGGFRDLMSEMSRMRAVARRGSSLADAPGSRAGDWYPAIDISARGADLVIRAEVAGVPPGEVELRVRDGVLTLSGHRREPPDLEGEPLVRERSYGGFQRAVALPDGADVAAIRAAYVHGVVTVTVPNALRGGGSDARRITIEEGDPS